MSDYMFMLENHLSGEQSRVVAEMQAAAAQANVNLFLTGGAMRDMLGGFPIRDLDFTVEGNALKLAKAVAQKAGARVVAEDDNRRSVELVFAGGVTAEISMSRQERYPKPGGKPQVTPASIYEDLRGRDFTMNSIALSLNRASRGLLLDPNNGLSDLERKELRAVGNYTFYDDPARLLRLLRFRVRLDFSIDERTRSQFDNAREAGMEAHIGPAALRKELRAIANEPNSGDLLRALDEERLATLFCPALTGAKVNLAGLAKLQKAKQLVPFGIDLRLDNLGLFLYALSEKLNSKERAALVATSSLSGSEVSVWQKLEPRAKKLERELKSPKLQKPSQLYARLSRAPGDEVLFLLLYSQVRLVHDRIKNYLQKYLTTAQEITDREVAARGVQPGTAKFQRLRDEMIANRLDGRTRKVVPPPPEPSPIGPGGRGSTRG